jgi:protein O-GlcNAc transferase
MSSAHLQMTWIGYPNTTGLRSIHYRVTDAIADPVDTSQQFSVNYFLCLA